MSKTSRPQILIGLMATLMFCACGKSKSGSSVAPAEHFSRAIPDQSHHAVTAPFFRKIQEIYSSEYTEDCDVNRKAQVEEIGAALDERQALISQYLDGLPESEKFRRVSFGPTVIREPRVIPSPKSGWTSEYSSWSAIYDGFQNVKISGTAADWSRLNAQVRSILTDDDYRITYGVNYYLKRDAYPNLRRLHTALTVCAADPRCVAPAYTRNLREFVDGNPYYLYFAKKIESTADAEATRGFIARFNKRLAADLKDCEFHKNDTILRTSLRELTVPMDSGSFEAVRTELASMIESIWSSPSRHVTVEWRNADPSPDLYKVLLGEHFGGRSYVSYSKKQVMLFPDVRRKSIAHEFGHVLGFSDHYYTTWDPSTCKYTTESREDDIMSDPDTGSVTDEEWSELFKVYR